MDTDVLKELVSLPEAARRLELHRATVNDMVITGRLPGYRVGAHWYVRQSDLDRFAHGYRRPKNSPRRRSRDWATAREGELVRWLGFWHSATADELATVVDLHVGNIRKYLALCEHRGWAERDDDGFWTLTASGAEWAAQLPPISDASHVA